MEDTNSIHGIIGSLELDTGTALGTSVGIS